MRGFSQPFHSWNDVNALKWFFCCCCLYYDEVKVAPFLDDIDVDIRQSLKEYQFYVVSLGRQQYKTSGNANFWRKLKLVVFRSISESHLFRVRTLQKASLYDNKTNSLHAVSPRTWSVIDNLWNYECVCRRFTWSMFAPDVGWTCVVKADCGQSRKW